MSIVNLRKNFTVNVDGLYKSFRSTSEDFVTEYGYTDVLYTLTAKSTFRTEFGSVCISATVELLDGAVTNVEFLKYVSWESIVERDSAENKLCDEVIDSLNELVNTWCGYKGFSFAQSILGVVLSIMSYDSKLKLYNGKEYSLLDIA